MIVITFVWESWKEKCKMWKSFLPRWASTMTQEAPTLVLTRSATRMDLKPDFVQMMYDANILYYHESEYKYSQCKQWMIHIYKYFPTVWHTVQALLDYYVSLLKWPISVTDGRSPGISMWQSLPCGPVRLINLSWAKCPPSSHDGHICPTAYFIFVSEHPTTSVPQICPFLYANEFWGLWKLYAKKVRKFATKISSRQNSVN